MAKCRNAARKCRTCALLRRVKRRLHKKERGIYGKEVGIARGSLQRDSYSPGGIGWEKNNERKAL